MDGVPGRPPSLLGKVTVVNYAVVVEREMTVRAKVLTRAGCAPRPQQMMRFIHFGFMQKGSGSLVVPLIYFWCGAIHIDAALSGSVCGRLATPVLHFLFSREENAQ